MRAYISVAKRKVKSREPTFFVYHADNRKSAPGKYGDSVTPKKKRITTRCTKLSAAAVQVETAPHRATNPDK